MKGNERFFSVKPQTLTEAYSIREKYLYGGIMFAEIIVKRSLVFSLVFSFGFEWG